MKKGPLYNIVLLFFILLIQSTRFDFWSIRGIKPDFILLFICLVSLKEGSISGTVFGFLGGTLQDVLSNGLLGSGGFAKSLWGYLIGKSSKRLDTNSMPVQIGVVFFFTILNGLLIHLINWLFDYPSSLKGGLILYISAQAVYNCIVWPLFACILAGIEKRTRTAD